MTLYVEVKPGSSLQQLMHLGSGGSPGGSGTTQTQAGGGIFKKIADLGAGQLLKLAGIGLGIGSLVGLMFKSSAILQGTFKILQMAFMLVLKPFGDMLGLLLRPLVMQLLLYAIPFYKVANKWIVDQLTGKAFGPLNPGGNGQFLQAQTDNVTKTLTDIAKKIQTAGSLYVGMLSVAWQNFINRLGGGLALIPSLVNTEFLTLAKGFASLFGELPGDMFKVFSDLANGFISLFAGLPGNFLKVFSDLGSQIWGLLQQAPGIIFTTFTTLANNFIDVLSSIPSTIVGIFGTLATNIENALKSIPSMIYNAIIGWIKSLGGAFGGGGSSQAAKPQAPTINRASIAMQAAYTPQQS